MTGSTLLLPTSRVIRILQGSQGWRQQGWDPGNSQGWPGLARAGQDTTQQAMEQRRPSADPDERGCEHPRTKGKALSQ
jgi:hypothetical protein